MRFVAILSAVMACSAACGDADRHDGLADADVGDDTGGQGDLPDGGDETDLDGGAGDGALDSDAVDADADADLGGLDTDDETADTGASDIPIVDDTGDTDAEPDTAGDAVADGDAETDMAADADGDADGPPDLDIDLPPDACAVPTETYPTLQAAVDDTDCTTISIAATTLVERVAVNRDLRIVGMGRDQTVLDGDAGGTVMTTTGSDTPSVVSLEHLSVRNGAAALGAGLRLTSADVTMIGVDVESNTLAVSGEIFALDGGGIYAVSSSLRLDDSVISNNICEAAVAGEVDFTIRGVGLSAIQSDVELVNGSRIDFNSASLSTTLTATVSLSGAGVHLSLGSFTADGGAVSDNTLELDGDGVVQGAGLNLESAESVLEGGHRIERNRASMQTAGDVETIGGGMRVLSGTQTIRGAVIADNALELVADGPSQITVFGGGAGYLVVGSLDVEDLVVTGNMASSIAMGATGQVEALGGGGGLFIGSSGTRLVRARIEDNVIRADNTDATDGLTEVSGGGLSVFSTASATVIDQSVIADNLAETHANVEAVTRGAGLDIASSVSFTLINSTISGNRALSRTEDAESSEVIHGAGAYVVNFAKEDVIGLYNVTVAANEAGAILNSGSPVVGGALVIDGTVLVNNSIVVTTDGETCIADDENLLSNGFNLFFGGDCGEPVSETDLTADPLLAELADNGGPTRTHALLASSPAIDAGHIDSCRDAMDDVLTVDQRDSPREDRCDIGAYED